MFFHQNEQNSAFSQFIFYIFLKSSFPTYLSAWNKDLLQVSFGLLKQGDRYWFSTVRIDFLLRQLFNSDVLFVDGVLLFITTYWFLKKLPIQLWKISIFDWTKSLRFDWFSEPFIRKRQKKKKRKNGAYQQQEKL